MEKIPKQGGCPAFGLQLTEDSLPVSGIEEDFTFDGNIRASLLRTYTERVCQKAFECLGELVYAKHLEQFIKMVSLLLAIEDKLTREMDLMPDTKTRGIGVDCFLTEAVSPALIRRTLFNPLFGGGPNIVKPITGYRSPAGPSTLFHMG